MHYILDGGARSKKSEGLQKHLYGEELMEHTYPSLEADSGKWSRLEAKHAFSCWPQMHPKVL